jgi:hypothetical protein
MSLLLLTQLLQNQFFLSYKHHVHLMKVFLVVHLHRTRSHLLLYGLTINTATFYLYEERGDLQITAAATNVSLRLCCYPFRSQCLFAVL